MNRKRLAVFTAAALTLSAVSGMSAMASSAKSFSIDVINSTDETWSRLAMTNDDTVSTGANIRDAVNGNVVACICRGGAVEVLDKGEEWTEVKSGDVTGYIKNEYLMYGSEAKGLADYYGVEGVEASWNDVHVFANPDANATIIHTAEAGETFQVVEDQGHWISVQYGADQLAYVSCEDVTKVLLVDEAVPLDEMEQEDASYDEAEEASYTEPSYSEPTYTEPAYTEPVYTEPATEPAYTEPAEPDYTDNTASETDTSGTGDEETWDDGEDDYVEDGTDEEVYTDDTADGTDTSADSDEVEEVEVVDDAEEYVEDEASQYADYTDEAVTDDTPDDYTEGGYEEYVEETEAAEEAAASTAGSSDLDLMAAIIYCEAGNQSYDGMVAVGAVVMNRVASSSFPNSISEVIYQSGQFTPASSGALASALANGVPSACYDAASAAMNGENPVGSALYFNAGSGSGMQIGDHQFY